MCTISPGARIALGWLKTRRMSSLGSNFFSTANRQCADGHASALLVPGSRLIHRYAFGEAHRVQIEFALGPAGLLQPRKVFGMPLSISSHLDRTSEGINPASKLPPHGIVGSVMRASNWGRSRCRANCFFDPLCTALVTFGSASRASRACSSTAPGGAGLMRPS